MRLPAMAAGRVPTSTGTRTTTGKRIFFRAGLSAGPTYFFHCIKSRHNSPGKTAKPPDLLLFCRGLGSCGTRSLSFAQTSSSRHASTLQPQISFDRIPRVSAIIVSRLRLKACDFTGTLEAPWYGCCVAAQYRQKCDVAVFLHCACTQYPPRSRKHA